LTTLAELLRQTPYAAYSYSYPHKTAYRRLSPAVSLDEVWAAERRDALFLYLHVPFCEMRCGFCNLFTTANPQAGLESAYLAALERQAMRVRESLGEASFARMAVGGGTPTYLDVRGLNTLFDLAERVFGVDTRRVPVSVETSPLTATDEKLRLLRERGASRVSIGVQSFDEAEVRAVGRSQKTADVLRALERIRAFGFPALNVDLMYGLPGQSVASWLGSLRRALAFAPEEIYLYPLYVRPLTGLGESEKLMSRAADDIRLQCYREGRALLVGAGYRQVSMRMFQAGGAKAEGGPAYCCQTDGMVGLGCGARSYTRALHYSGEYAVGAGGVRAIIADYVNKPDVAFAFADYGYKLDAADQRRRFVIQSLLQAEGLSLAAYRDRFGTESADDLPELNELPNHGLAIQDGDSLRLTEAGVEKSDAIGPWLYSAKARGLMEAYELR
jgi:oxygen-independent coproporphyrinogen III oxidase